MASAIRVEERLRASFYYAGLGHGLHGSEAATDQSETRMHGVESRCA